MFTRDNGYCKAGLLAATLFVICSAVPVVGPVRGEVEAASPGAAELVRGIIRDESKILSLPSLRVRKESTRTLTPERLAELRAKRGQDLPATSTGSSEFILDPRRYRNEITVNDNDGHVVRKTIDVWNGEVRKQYTLGRTAQDKELSRYEIASTLMHGPVIRTLSVWLEPQRPALIPFPHTHWKRPGNPSARNFAGMRGGQVRRR